MLLCLFLTLFAYNCTIFGDLRLEYASFAGEKS